MINFVIDANELKIFSKPEEFVNFPLIPIDVIPHGHIGRMFCFPIINYCGFITDSCCSIWKFYRWFIYKMWIRELILLKDCPSHVAALKSYAQPLATHMIRELRTFVLSCDQSCISLWCLVRWLDVLSNSSENSFCKSCIILFETNNGMCGIFSRFFGPHLWLNFRFT